MKIMKKNKGILFTLIAIISIIFISASRSSESHPEDVSVYTPSANLLAISELGGGGLISTTGEVKSSQRYDVRSQMSETVEWISADIGDTVGAGQVVVQLNNDSLITQRDQLRAALAGEQAQLQELKGGTRPEQLAILKSQVDAAELSVTNSATNLNTALQTAYTQADDLIHNTLDTFFNDPETLQPDFVYTTNNSQIERSLENDRVVLEQILNEWNMLIYTENSIGQDQLALAATAVEEDLEYLGTYLDSLAEVVNDLTPSSNTSESTIATLRTQVSAMRNTVNAAISSLSQTRDAVSVYQSQYTVAQNQLALAEAGATEGQIQIQESRVAAAEANLRSNAAALSKASLSSPIFGTISELSVDVGDLVSPGQLLFRVLNDDAFTITAFVSPSEALRISEGNVVTIEDVVQASVTKISPSVNSETQKVELHIAISDTTDLIDGQFVNIDIQTTQSQDIYVPLTAVKTVADQSYVYTVDIDGLAVAVPVDLGDILGSGIQILGISTLPELIIEDARDIDDGDLVIIR